MSSLKGPNSLLDSIHRHRWNSSFRLVVEELKLVRSLQDLSNLYEKAAYTFPRTGKVLRRSEQTPPSLQIEPTNVCNVRCICCSTSTSARNKGFMDFGLFTKIIDDAAQVGVQRIHLYLHGEPTLHNRIVEMVRYAKLQRLAVHLTTNGMLFTPEMADGLLRAGVSNADHVTFSILGRSPQVHETIMRGVDSDKVRSNLVKFLELRAERRVNGPVIETLFHTMPQNAHELDQFIEDWQGVVDHVRLGGVISDSFAGYKGSAAEVSRDKPCKLVFERMPVFWNGDVTVCCMDVDGDYVVGNLTERSVTELWQSRPMAAMRALHRNGKFRDNPFCANCDL
jgi:radical SAM protein with 4Fe4S-binding SPASM domain